MLRKDIILMSMKELRRLPVVYSVINGRITQQEAADILGLCRQQIGRIVTKVTQKGNTELAHSLRGKPSNRATNIELKNKILHLSRTIYQGFGPTLAAEKLFEIEKINIHPETLRLWLVEAGIDYKKRRAPKHRSWRPRRDSFGHMVQLDGSHHDWLEGRAPWCVLMGYVDDATSRVFAHFYEYEGTKPAMDSFRRYIKRYGLPQSVYLDKHATYRSTKKLTIEEELNNARALSQFERALKELRVDVIHADSPQAKGRVERSFRTHQDRLIKEMRLKDIKTIKDANKFLHSYYIPKHNRKFAVIAKDKTNLHTPIPKHLNLERIFSIKKQAALRKDFTIQYNNKFYQILNTIRTKTVTVEEHLDGKLYIYHKDTKLRYKLTDKRHPQPKPSRQQRRIYAPQTKDHPWRQYKRKCA